MKTFTGFMKGLFISVVIIIVAAYIIGSHGSGNQNNKTDGDEPTVKQSTQEASPAAQVPPPAEWTSSERAAPIEPTATLSDHMKSHLSLIDDSVVIVRAKGYDCKSVSGAVEMVFARGVNLWCNHNAYHYELVDKGKVGDVEVTSE